MNPAQKYQQAQQAFAQGDWARAKDLFGQVVRFDKKNEQIHTAMGFCAARLGQFDEGRRHLAKAVKLKPMSPDPHVQLGYLEAADFNSDAALAHYKRAALLKPGHPPAVFGLVDVLRKQGSYDEAAKELRVALDKANSMDVQLAEALALIAVKTGQQAEAIDAINQVLGTDLDDKPRALMLFRLAALLNDQGDYDGAFDAVELGSRLKGVPWDAAGYDAQVRGFLDAWTPEVFESVAKSNEQSEQPVFILGLPRSGTSLVEQIIASHPDATGVGELSAMVGIAGSLQMNLTGALSIFFTEAGRLTPELLDEGAKQYLGAMHTLAGKLGVSPSATRIADKQPHNFAHIPLIRAMFPNARIIYTQRDARDTAVSCFFQGFDGPMGYCYDLNALGRYIAHERRIVRHAAESLGIELMTARYEDVVGDPETQIRAMLDHVGLPFHEDCLSFHKTHRQVVTASTDQVRQPIYKGSLARWKRYETRLGPLFEGFEQGGFDPDSEC